MDPTVCPTTTTTTTTTYIVVMIDVGNAILPNSKFSNYLLKSTVVRFTVQTKNTITNNYSQIISQIAQLILLQLVN